MLAVVPPVAFGAVAYGRRVRKLSKEVQDSLAESNQLMAESFTRPDFAEGVATFVEGREPRFEGLSERP